MSSTLPIDVIILANCQTDELYQMTIQAINSLGNVNNVIWLEGNTKLQDERITAYQRKPFNFNKCLQDAEQYLKKKNNAVLIVNNDIESMPNCVSLLHAHLDVWDSVSPMCPIRHKGFKGVRQGYRRAHEVCGWAIMFHKRILKKLTFKDLFPSELKFWRQDQYYADMIQQKRFRHALIGDAKLLHYENMTHDYLTDKEQYTKGMFQVYEKLKRKQGKIKVTPTTYSR